MGKNLDWLKNLAVTVVALGAVVTAVGFVPRDAGYVYTVGIVQLVRHTALDAATQGFTDELQSLMEEAGKTVKIDYQDAQNDTVNCSVIANNFVAKGYDLIMANATAALQASYNATETIPVLGTSVTVYDVALGLDNYVSGEGTGTNVSGTSDLAPLSEQADMIAELVPEARKVGLLYCSSEANSRYQVEEVKRCLEERNEGYECTLYAFSDSNDISAVVQQMGGTKRGSLCAHRQHGGFKHPAHRQHLPPRRHTRNRWRRGHLQRLRNSHAFHKLRKSGQNNGGHCGAHTARRRICGRHSDSLRRSSRKKIQRRNMRRIGN